MSYERADAITTRYAEYSETSRIFTFYTRRFGRISALAKGAKRKYSKLIGHVDLLSHCEIVFISGQTRGRLHILTEANATETFPGLRTDLARYYAACHAAELVNQMTGAEDPNAELFDRFLELLRALDGGADPVLALFAFEAHLLVLTGFMPELSACVGCGRAIRERRVSFSAQRGGVMCGKCAPGEAYRMDGLSAGALGLLDRLARGKVTRMERIKVSAPAARQMREFLNEYERHVLGRELRTVRHL